MRFGSRPSYSSLFIRVQPGIPAHDPRVCAHCCDKLSPCRIGLACTGSASAESPANCAEGTGVMMLSGSAEGHQDLQPDPSDADGQRDTGG